MCAYLLMCLFQYVHIFVHIHSSKCVCIYVYCLYTYRSNHLLILVCLDVYTAHGGDQTHKIFGSPDLSVFRIDLLSDGDSVYSRVNSFEISGTPVQTYLICTGIPVRTFGIFGSRNYFKSNLLRP